MTFGSLFSGIGGFDLGLEKAGLVCKWQVENDPYCLNILSKHWPHVPKYADIRDVGNELEPVDIICGGFPCQDISNAGKRAGIDGERSGLWREMFRVCGLLRPGYIVIENVAAIVIRGLSRVLGDLAAIGYDAERQSLPAAAFGAPHLRFRTFVIAYPHRQGNQGEGSPTQRVFRPFALRSFAPAAWGDVSEWEKWVHQPELCRVPYGFPAIVDRIRSLGNAVVPAVSEYIGECLSQANNGLQLTARGAGEN